MSKVRNLSTALNQNVRSYLTVTLIAECRRVVNNHSYHCPITFCVLNTAPMKKPHSGGRRQAEPSAVKAWNRHRPKAVRPLAAYLEISQPAVSKWKQVPFDRLDKTAEFLGLQPIDLRPDLYAAARMPWNNLIERN